jgi:RHS repeat-associated protein
MSWSTPDSSGGRMYSGAGYRYGFNGQEKDDELGAGVTTAEFWMYDGKLGRRWNVDPKPNAFLSNYAVLANNAIIFTDPLGDVFIIGINDKQAQKDVISMVKVKNRKFIRINEKSGEVTLDFGNLDSKKIDKLLLKDERLKVISDLSGAKKSNGEELYIYYGTEGETKIGLEDPINRKEVADYYSNISTYTNKGNGENGYDIRAFVLTASYQQYSNTLDFGLKPLDHFHGKVFIGPGRFLTKETVIDYNNPKIAPNGSVVGYNTKDAYFEINRSDLVYHELRENMLRTVKGYCYDRAHKEAGGYGDCMNCRYFP